ncbi:uncharacterized protein EV422DRAFT_510482 [Fimicolochytrium jonesii]|uniref:uncharacterized protein n=1 Tax=Fimicolochytrium jonesii TaxID=1396493 RepID=UPI0022FDF9ED|nr:uncharacterized protein EV422DRAFT_510482 [Fimicolochytrium jonesii]KAI8815589.1 hypothetical protein EV422DRAFT_510482 [Fimicolochytrium jonesii]
MAARAAPEDPAKNSVFTRSEIEVLQRRFIDLLPVPTNTAFGGADRDPLAALATGKIDRAKFRDLLADVFGVDDSLLMDRVFRTFDTDADNYISYDEFIKGMSVFLKGRLEERSKFCFRVYDLNGDRYVSKEEMYQMLRNCLVRGQEEDEDGVKDLVDLVLKKLDEDRDGRVSEADWAVAIGKEQLLMEAFGQCLPRAGAITDYLSPTVKIDGIGTSIKPSGNLAAPSRSAHAGGRLPGPIANSTMSIASELATEAVDAMQPIHSHHQHPVSKHVHPHAQRPKRIVVAPAASIPKRDTSVPRGAAGGANQAAGGGGASSQATQVRRPKPVAA